MLHREKAHVKLAKYIATCGDEVTHADLMEALPFFRKGTGCKPQ
jgi:retron-type reverse transcriptase